MLRKTLRAKVVCIAQVLLLISLNMVTPVIHFSRNCQTEVMFRSYICRDRYFSGHQMLHSFFIPWETSSMLSCWCKSGCVFYDTGSPHLLSCQSACQQILLTDPAPSWHFNLKLTTHSLCVCSPPAFCLHDPGRMLAHVCVCDLPLPPCILNHRAPPPYQHVVLSLLTWCTWHVSLDIVH